MRRGRLDEGEDDANVRFLGVSGRREVRAAAAVARQIGLAQEGGRKDACAARPSGRRQQATGPLGPERGSGKEKKFPFSDLIFQIQFSIVFEYLLNFDSNQSSQKYNATA
jgi:hypothetical protein